MPPRRLSLIVVRCLCLLSLIAVFDRPTAGDSTDDDDDDVGGDDVTAGTPAWNPRRGGAGVCARCASSEALLGLPQADVIRLHVERIKRELLRKLGLSAPPNVTGIPLPSMHFLPPPLLPGNPAGDVTGEDGVFPDDEINYGTAGIMSDDIVSSSQHHDDYFYHDDDVDDDDDGGVDNDDGGFEEELDLNGDDYLGPPELPPRTKQVIVLGRRRKYLIISASLHH